MFNAVVICTLNYRSDDNNITLLRKVLVRTYIGLMWLIRWLLVGCGYGNQPSGSVNAGQNLYQLSHCQHLKDFAPCCCSVLTIAMQVRVVSKKWKLAVARFETWRLSAFLECKI